jgi:phenylpropionate dioxygenase-like ring-hydroxylating dioxygenase large terminal subunit
LVEIPDEERFCPGVDKSKRSLQPVKLELWSGMVWINMDPDAMPLTDYLGTIMGNLEPFHFENMVLAKHQTVTIAANWKTARDNFLEQYHVDFIHPQHASLVDCCNSTNILWPYGHSATMVEGYVTDSRYPVPVETPDHLVVLLEGIGLDPQDFKGRVPDIRPAVQKQKREIGKQLGFDYSSLSDEQVSDVWQYDIFPNTFMTIQAEELWIYGPRPHPADPDKCFFDKWTLQIPTEIGCDTDRGLTLNPRLVASRDDERPEHEVFDQADVIAGKHSLTITLDQDIYYLADMQAGMHSRGFDRAVLNEDEVRVQHFHDWVGHFLGQHSV